MIGRPLKSLRHSAEYAWGGPHAAARTHPMDGDRKEKGSVAGMSDRMTLRSRQGAARARILFLATLLAAAVHLAQAPEALAAIAFVKNVGFDANSTTGTSISITIPAGGVAFGHTLLVSFAMD